MSSSPLPETIYQHLRSEMLSGALKPGETLRQEVCAQQFGASRVPVREALSRLEAEGLIMLRPRRGYVVTSLDESEILEVFELRMVVEQHAGYVAGRARNEADVKDVEKLLKQLDALDENAAEYEAGWAKLNMEFHDRLIASARRKHLSRIARQLRDTTEPYIRVEARMTGDMKAAREQHWEIFAAFKAGDATSLAELCQKHVESTAKRLLKGLRARTISTNGK